MDITQNKVSNMTKWSYGLGGFGKDFGLNVINIYLFFYYTDVVGVSAAFIGSVFLFARIWDTVNDPMLGYLVAKTKSKWGRYKPWILIGNILNAITLIAVFCAHLFDGTGQLIYIAITYVLWGMTYTMLDAPFWSLIPTITLDKSEREGLMPYPRLFATAASYLAGGVGIYVVSFFGQGDKGTGYIYFGILAAILALLSGIITCFGTKSNLVEEPEQVDKFSLKDAIKLVMNNDQFIALISLSLLYNISLNFMNGLNLYFYKYVINDESLFSTSMFFAGIAGVICLIFFKFLVGRYGRRYLFIFSLMAPICSAIALWLSANVFGASIILVSIAGIFTGLSSALYWLILLVMVADTVDYGDVKLNIRSESVLYSVNTLISKCSGALTGFLVGIALTMIGYVANTTQSHETVIGLQFIYFMPALLCLVSYFIYKKFYKLNDNELVEIQHTLEAKYNKEG